MSDAAAPARLDAVERVRANQRAWIARTREEVAAGGPFAICNGDEAEEIFLSLGIPVLAINYWNFLILAQRKGGHYNQVLREHGFARPHMFALGLASSLAPAEAPWGGLPKPTILCGSPRAEMEMRVTELWAGAADAAHFPMDFSFPAEHFRPLPADWWNWTFDRWEELVDPHRLQFRVEQERILISWLEERTGRRFDVSDLLRTMLRGNEQMAFWAEARALIAATTPCPVSLRDQMSMYQAMWHRGTDIGTSLLRDYVAEVRERVAAGIGAYRNERVRYHYTGDTPPWAGWAEETFGAVPVSNFYSGIPDLYARRIDPADPLRALAARHLFLFSMDAGFMVHQAAAHRCDAIVAVEANMERYPAGVHSVEQDAAERAGIGYLALPRTADDADTRERVARFFG